MVAVETGPRRPDPVPGAVPRLLLPGSDHAAVEERLAPGIAARDAAGPGRPVGREVVVGLSSWVDARLAAAGQPGDRPARDLSFVGQVIASAAWVDLSVAFPLWCHRMVIEYLADAAHARPGLDQALLPATRRGDLIGSTALAPAIAHVVAGTPLPVTWREEHGGDVVLDGRLRWASNLFPPDCLLVTGAMHAGGGRPILVAIPGRAAGVQVDPYPELLALGATGSSSVRLDAVRVSGNHVLASNLREFITAVRAPFLLLQSCFALGLARRSLDEAGEALARTTSPATRTFAADLARAEGAYMDAVVPLTRDLACRGAGTPVREIVARRLDAARLATEAVALESKVIGGRSFVASAGTARRLRESAFLPVQAPTEGQLRWELSLSE